MSEHWQLSTNERGMTVITEQRLRDLVSTAEDLAGWLDPDSQPVELLVVQGAVDLVGEVRRLRDLIADMQCDCLPYAEPHDGMCQRCMAIGGHLEPVL